MKIIKFNNAYFGRFRNVQRFSKKRAKELKQYIIETSVKRFKKGVLNKTTGINILVSTNGIKHALYHDNLIIQCKAITCLDELLKSAVLYSIEPDKHNSYNTHLRLLASMFIDESLYHVKINIKIQENVRFYDLTAIDVIKKP